MKISFLGSSLLSAYWNGAATYYRGIVRELAGLGYQIAFFEPDAYGRQQHRDIREPNWAKVFVYPTHSIDEVSCMLEKAAQADLIIKASGVGVFDEFLEHEIASLHGPSRHTAFWDVDAPATLQRITTRTNDPFRPLIKKFDYILTYGGGDEVVKSYKRLGAEVCAPIYNALDPETHFPVQPDSALSSTLTFVGNRLPDREKRVEEFFFKPAARLKDYKFILGGQGWESKSVPRNVVYHGHVYTRDHNLFNCSARAVLNINRESMAEVGFSPPTRIFEAAGAAGCIISDRWPGIEMFLEPGREILTAEDGDDVFGCLVDLTDRKARAIGVAARTRVMREHTYAHRAREVDRVFTS